MSVTREPDDVFAAKDRLGGVGVVADPHPRLPVNQR
jgi:hypothetical protein